MIPRTFPSTYASNGQQQMVVHFLTSVEGLARWSDYIPVKLVQGGPENSYSGTIDVAVIPSLTADTQAWKEYIPVYADDSATDAWTVNAVGYIPYNYALFNDASMQLDLTNGGALDPRVTFTRTSNATVTDSTGTLVYAPHNLLTFSEQFDNAAWAKASGVITPNSVVAPNGTNTADVYTENNGTTGELLLTSALTFAADFTFTISGYFKTNAGGEAIQLFSTAGGNGFQVTVNLLTGGVISASVFGTGTYISNSVEDVGDGWYRVAVTGKIASGATARQWRVSLKNSAGSAQTGDGVKGFVVWGAQLNVGSLQPYYPTTRKNLLGFTQEFDNAGWVKTRSSVTANSTVAPDGTLTGDSLIADTAASTTHFATQSASFTSGGVYTATLYAKQAGIRYVRLGFSVTAFGAIQVAFFDLQDGVVTSTSGTVTTSIENAGNGWWRVRVTATATATASDTISINLSLNGTSSNFTGDGTSGIFIWGAQLSDSASLDPYVYNPGAAPASTAYYGPRFDYDPVTLAPKGLLIEEQRTNSLTFSEQFDDASWVKSNSTITANTIVSPNGTLDADKFVSNSGQTGNVNKPSLSFTSGTVYTASFYAKKGEFDSILLRVGSAAFTGTVAARTVTFNLTSGTVTTTGASWTSASMTAVGNGWYRCVGTISATSTASDTLFLVGNNTGDGTSGIFIWGAQLEAGAFPTSYIPTTTAAATRAADVAVMQGANFSNWYNQTEGALFAEYAAIFNTNREVLDLNDGTANNRVQMRIASGSQAQFSISVGGTNQVNIAPSGYSTIGQTYKRAIALKVDDFSQVIDGVVTGTDSLGSLPSVDRMSIGVNLSAGGGVGHIRRIAYYPRRLSNAELQGVTA